MQICCKAALEYTLKHAHNGTESRISHLLTRVLRFQVTADANTVTSFTFLSLWNAGVKAGDKNVMALQQRASVVAGARPLLRTRATIPSRAIRAVLEVRFP